MDQATFFRKDLPGGARVVAESVPGRRSLALGLWIRAGSRDEDPGREGMAHFIEHLVFKGSRHRTGKEIAASLERVGGSLDAFTTKDVTCFHARVLEEHADLAVDVIADLVSHPLFAPADVETEREVVLEEIRSVEDAPEDLIGDLAMLQLWPDHIMGASILGTRESLRAIRPEQVGEFHQRCYRAPQVVVSAAGAVDPDRLAGLLEEKLSLPAEPSTSVRRAPEPALSTFTLYPEDLAQLYLSLAVPAPSDRDPRRRAVHLLVEIFGGGMSSRLFQAIREDAGLAYSVFAYSEHFEDSGYLGTALAVSPRRGRDALERTLDEMRLLTRDGLRPGELDAAQAQVRGSLLMGMESLTNRMTRLARAELRSGRRETEQEILAAYEAITETDVLAVAEELLDPARQSLVALGPAKTGDLAVLPFLRVAEAAS
jgi:predicted Zn-dependent peptidase